MPFRSSMEMLVSTSPPFSRASAESTLQPFSFVKVTLALYLLRSASVRVMTAFMAVRTVSPFSVVLTVLPPRLTSISQVVPAARLAREVKFRVQISPLSMASPL